MGWKDLAKVGKDWADAKKGELTADAATTFLEKVLPADLAKVVTDQRPENVAAREAERATQQEQQRRSDLAGKHTAHLEITLSGEESGTLAVTLPADRTEDDPHPASDPDYPDQPPPMPWLKILLEAPDPVPLGSTTLSLLSLAVPDYRGVPGRYDLADLYRRGESGELESWEVFDLCLSPTQEADDRTWYYDSSLPGTIDVAEDTVSFDLSMQSAASAIRAVGTITWA